MKLLRYSFHGFNPQFQENHLKKVNYHLNEFNINAYPEHSRYFIEKIHQDRKVFYTENLEDFKYGVWAFIDGYKDNQSLNHLKKLVPAWTAEIDDSAIVYDCNWEYKMSITDPKCKIHGVYIPQSQLHLLRNVEKLKRKE